MKRNSWRRIGHLVIGAIVGLIVGAIVAVNVVITAGIDRGYESSLIDVFEENAVVGVVTVAILVGGPIVGAIVVSRMRKDRDR